MSPRGILTSTPTKLIHNLLDQPNPRRDTELLLTVCVSPERVELYKRSPIGKVFPLSPNQPVGGILGFHSAHRSTYCSFAVSHCTHGHPMRGFHEALSFEIEAIGRLLKRLGVAVESVYVGVECPQPFRKSSRPLALAGRVRLSEYRSSLWKWKVGDYHP